MKREFHSWHSPRLDREMPLLVFGHAGEKVLVFPTRDGHFDEYEKLGVVETLRPRIEAGELQLYCADSIDWEAFYCFWCRPADRLARHMLYETYVLEELLPWMQARNDHPVTVAHGLSFGAFHAATLAFRHPQRFQKLRAFSGRFDVTLAVEHFRDLLDGYRDAHLYYYTPTQFLPGLNGWQLEALRAMDIVLAVGREDPFLDNNRLLSQILTDLDVRHELHIWDGRAHCGRAWRQMVPLYL